MKLKPNDMKILITRNNNLIESIYSRLRLNGVKFILLNSLEKAPRFLKLLIPLQIFSYVSKMSLEHMSLESKTEKKSLFIEFSSVFFNAFFISSREMNS